MNIELFQTLGLILAVLFFFLGVALFVFATHPKHVYNRLMLASYLMASLFGLAVFLTSIPSHLLSKHKSTSSCEMRIEKVKEIIND